MVNETIISTENKSEEKPLNENKVDPRNKLNELNGRNWIKATKSVWYSRPPQRDKLKEQHPATYPESDIEQLIKFFTKEGQTVLDPFLGSGSTLMACHDTKRFGTGIELIDKWVEISQERIKQVETQKILDSFVTGQETTQKVIHGDAEEGLKKFDRDFFHFIVTSPPYWGILNKPLDHKTKRERTGKGLDVKYSEDEKDLANVKKYSDFLKSLQKVWKECYRVLKKKRYMCVVVSDFRHKSRFILYHADIAKSMEEVGFILKGMIILVQDSKALYPYGYPFEYVPNIHHQTILIFKKDENNEKLKDISNGQRR